jgi:hypothetical protein
MITRQPDLIDAILSLYRDDINWCDAQGIISWKDAHETTQQESQAIDAELARLQAEFDAKEYQRDRATAYPSIADQLDALYHGGYDAWKATITAVKEEFPKP